MVQPRGPLACPGHSATPCSAVAAGPRRPSGACNAAGPGRRAAPERHPAAPASPGQPRKGRPITGRAKCAAGGTLAGRGAHAPPSWTLSLGTRPGVPLGPPEVGGARATGQGVGGERPYSTLQPLLASAEEEPRHSVRSQTRAGIHTRRLGQKWAGRSCPAELDPELRHPLAHAHGAARGGRAARVSPGTRPPGGKNESERTRLSGDLGVGLQRNAHSVRSPAHAVGTASYSLT